MIIDKEFSSLIKPLSENEFKQLEENILAEGIRESLIVWDDGTNRILIDGHNRYKIAQKHNLPYNQRRMMFKSRDDVILWMIDNQLGKRNLQTIDAIILHQKKSEIIQKKAKENQGTRTDLTSCPNGQKVEPIHTRDEIAKLAGVGSGTVARVEQIQKKAPELVDKVRAGEITINQAYRQVVPKPKDTSVIDAQKKHDEFKQNDASVISIAEIKDDKANMDILARDFFLKTMKALDQFENIDFFKTDEERRELANALSSENKNILAARLARATNKIHYLKELIGGNKC